MAWYSYCGSDCSLLPGGLHCGSNWTVVSLAEDLEDGYSLDPNMKPFSFQEATELCFHAVACWQGNHILLLMLSTGKRVQRGGRGPTFAMHELPSSASRAAPRWPPWGWDEKRASSPSTVTAPQLEIPISSCSPGVVYEPFWLVNVGS